ncbi:hypothetical protein L2E82_38364 [Cichorium intybus]|uniref:Uncharacterized protein n=1 Tax=Cichorium intybus TaxID=13427 RepID=A0ACB9AGI3_CICIN|nr:hypothetical protein L2E82_38364 [Cichorium intybus]
MDLRDATDHMVATRALFNSNYKLSLSLAILLHPINQELYTHILSKKPTTRNLKTLKSLHLATRIKPHNRKKQDIFPTPKLQTSKQPLPDTKPQTSKQPLPDTKYHQNLIQPEQRTRIEASKKIVIFICYR